MKIIKKNGLAENYNFNKIKLAVSKSASRVNVKFTDKDWQLLEVNLLKLLGQDNEISVEQVHKAVENSLEIVSPKTAKSYKDYRNYKKDYACIMEKVLANADELNYKVDKSNANTTAALISTKRSLIYTGLNKERYKSFELSKDELKAVEDGYIYIHDLGARSDTYNCCLFDMGKILQGGFEWEHIGYNEPKDVRTACNLISDITLNCAAQQYGGFTIPEIDSILAPYAEKSYRKYKDEYMNIVLSNKASEMTDMEKLYLNSRSHQYAIEKLEKDLSQGFQGFEHTFNTVASSRGDFPFVTMSGGCEENIFGQLVWKTALRVRREGQGHPGNKRPAIFPKLVFLYTEKLHGEGKPLYDLYKEGVICSSKAMYPDWLSLDKPNPEDIQDCYTLDLKSSLAEVFHRYHKFGVSRWVLNNENNVIENPEWVDSIVSPMGAARGDELVSIKIFENTYTDIPIKEAFNLILDITGGQDNHGGKCFEGQVPSEFNNKCGVYKLTDLKSNLFYIGSSKNIGRRFIEHWSTFKHKGCLGDNYFVNNFDLNDLRIEILEECDIDHLFELESKYVNFKNKDKNCVNFKDPINNGNFNSETRIKALNEEKYSTFNNKGLTWFKKIYNSEIKIKSSNEFVPIRCLIRNDASSSLKMYEITYNKKGNNFKLNITEDHPLHTQRGRIRADELQINDKLIDSVTYELYPITNINLTGEKCETFDFETDNDKFDLSGIISHNCRAYLSPLYESGNLKPINENDKPIFHGRFNGGAVSLNLPMILAKSKEEKKDFFDVLNYYLDMINEIHIKTYYFLCKLKASCNPLAFCEGGFGKLNPSDSIKPLVDRITFSYGFTALNELQELATKESLYEVKDNSNSFALKTLKYIVDYVEQKKRERNEGKVPYIAAIYATPAESVCLAGDTIVLTYGGDKMIKDLKEYDLVYSFNEEENKVELKPVLFSGKTGENKKVIKINFKDGKSITCTSTHKFALNTNPIIYVKAKDLKPETKVKAFSLIENEEFVEVESIEEVKKRIDVYDITVKDNHNFYVGEKCAVLVHNCGTQLEQFRKKYGVIKKVSDRAYFTNSFHMWVGEEITPYEKQDAEYNYFHLSSGGHIQYCRFPNGDNLTVLDKTIRRAMKLGYYFGVNIESSYCGDCGCKVDDAVEECPCCRSKNITTINRVCGYLGYSRVAGDTKMNDAKMAEIKDRKSM